MDGATGRAGMLTDHRQLTLLRRRHQRRQVRGHHSNGGLQIGSGLERKIGRGRRKEVDIGVEKGTGASFFVLTASPQQ